MIEYFLKLLPHVLVVVKCSKPGASQELGAATQSILFLRLRLLQQNYIRLKLEVEQNKVFPIGRPVEGINLAEREMCNLVASRSVKWLDPKVIGSLLVDGIRKSRPIWRELHTA